ncbi:MAG TPA: HAMP domain-containing sensor histidine kinase [Vicinamibacteria bacterium]|nr:HAMP domain-containing sensor histidine kinase [Vicinamibacteria bacterium]
MRRLSVMFLGLGVVLLGALAVLVGRALESLSRERELRHQAVAERIFDEMERGLTELVEREESRPFEHYRHFYVSSTTGVLERSPLADLPAEPFVVGYYQVGPGGDITTPLDDEGLSVGRIYEIVKAAGATRLEERKPLARKELQSPGTTRNVAMPDDSREDVSESSVYLKSINELNRATLEREQRPVSKLTQMATSNLADESARSQKASVDVVVQSMRGRLAGAQYLLLSRTALSAGASYEQGLVIHVERLVEWLDDKVLGTSDLSRLAEVSTEPSEPTTAFSGYRYRRQFAEPFDSVGGVLTLASLPEASGVEYVYWMSALLAAALIAGLAGLYRMVGVTVEFAERQKNFVSAVTHELKTPLTAIRMYGEMLREGLVDDEEKRKHYYEVITSESERLTRLVGNVLELSQLERKNRHLRLVSGSVTPVLQEIVEILGPQARREGLEIRVETEDGLPNALYDRDALIQVLFNLVDNAIKYSRQADRAREIVLRARRQGGAVVVAVIDAGPGVKEEHLRHVFEAFYRAESELTRRSKGTGIGLSLVRGLVEAMGGEVEGKNVDTGGFSVSVVLRASG